MFRWNLMLRKLFTPPPLYRNALRRSAFALPHEQTARRRQATVRPKLEPIEDRILLSAAGTNLLPMATVASPPPWHSAAAVISYAESTLDQVMAAVQQDVSSIAQALAQVENYLVQPWEHLLGIPSARSPVASNAGQ